MIRYYLLGLMISLGLCEGCKTTEPEKPSPKLEIGRQMAVLKVSTNDGFATQVPSAYKVEVCLWNERLADAGEDIRTDTQDADWLRKTMNVEVPPNMVVDILSAPQVTPPPNEWRTMESVQRISSCIAQTSFWMDGELLTVGSHPGLTLKAFVEPLDGNWVRVKGAMVHAIMSPSGTRYHAFPFDVEMTVGSSVIVYERAVELTTKK